MKNRFVLTVRGADWWLPFSLYWVVTILTYAAQQLLKGPEGSAGANAGATLVTTLVVFFILIIVGSVYTIILYGIFFPKISIGGKSLAFDGTIGRYLGIVIPGILLSAVTAGVYIAWLVRRVTAYLAAHTRLDGEPLEFLGKGGKLFVYALVSLVVPVLVVSGGIGAMAALTTAHGASAAATELASSLAVLIVFLFLVPFLYLMYKWYANLRWRGLVFRWKTRFWPSVLMILGQSLLTLVTVGIYWPAAALRLYRYFVGRSVVMRGDEEAGRFGFDGSLGRGFGLIWGQTLLTIITIGFYAPWGYSKVGRWLLDATWYESTQPASPLYEPAAAP